MALGMAWRPDKCIIRGEFDNTVRGRVTGLFFSFTMPNPPGLGMRLDIESSGDLVTWDVPATRIGDGPWSGPVPVNLRSAGPGWESVTLTIPTSPNRRRFYRLTVQAWPPP